MELRFTMPLTSKSLLTASPLKLGYKLSKWITAIHVLSTLNPQRLGTWEDQGYEWFAGL